MVRDEVDDQQRNSCPYWKYRLNSGSVDLPVAIEIEFSNDGEGTFLMKSQITDLAESWIEGDDAAGFGFVEEDSGIWLAFEEGIHEDESRTYHD